MRATVEHIANTLVNGLTNATFSNIEECDVDCYRVFIMHKNGSLIIYSGIDNTISLEEGGLTTNEISFVRGVCRQNDFESYLTDEDE